MAAKNQKEEAKKFAKKERGTSDDIEVLMLILKENPSIRLKVMEKVKQARTRIEIREKQPGNRQA